MGLDKTNPPREDNPGTARKNRAKSADKKKLSNSTKEDVTAALKKGDPVLCGSHTAMRGMEAA
jgi:hypothetical protein